MKLDREIRAAASGVVRSLKNAAVNCKMDGQIANEEKTIEDLTLEIGTLSLRKLDGGAEMTPEIMERYAAIQAARSNIHTSTESKKTEKAVCPKCGAKTAKSMRYCGSCGALMNA